LCLLYINKTFNCSSNTKENKGKLIINIQLNYKHSHLHKYRVKSSLHTWVDIDRKHKKKNLRLSKILSPHTRANPMQLDRSLIYLMFRGSSWKIIAAAYIRLSFCAPLTIKAQRKRKSNASGHNNLNINKAFHQDGSVKYLSPRQVLFTIALAHWFAGSFGGQNLTEYYTEVMAKQC
jgi:hypothetical protein